MQVTGYALISQRCKCCVLLTIVVGVGALKMVLGRMVQHCDVSAVINFTSNFTPASDAIINSMPLLIVGRYNWAPGILDQGVAVAQATSGCEYIPMIWGEKDLTNQRLANLDVLEGQVSSLLGFNEPNFQAQVGHVGEELARAVRVSNGLMACVAYGMLVDTLVREEQYYFRTYTTPRPDCTMLHLATPVGTSVAG